MQGWSRGEVEGARGNLKLMRANCPTAFSKEENATEALELEASVWAAEGDDWRKHYREAEVEEKGKSGFVPGSSHKTAQPEFMIKALLKHMGLYEYEVKGVGDTAVSERTMYELSHKLTRMVQKTQNQVNGNPSSGNRNNVGLLS